MFRKSSILALAASALFGVTMLTSTAAEARGHGGGGGGGIHRGGGGMRIHGGGHFRRHGHFHRHVHHRHHRHWHRHYVRYRPIWYTAPVAYSVVRPVAGPCTCLTKEYTPEGAVLFKDRCTNEMAMNPPPLAPAQTGQIEPQSQVQYVPQYPPQTTVK
jgi:hypothetical protein